MIKQMLAHLQVPLRQHPRSYQRLPQHHDQNHPSCSHALPHIPIISLHIHRLLRFQWHIFKKTRHLKKSRILSGLIQFSRLKLAFFKKVAFFANPACHRSFSEKSLFFDLMIQGKLKGTSVMLACLNVCWVHSVYLDPLLPKFWKMTLQLLSRYSQWMEELRSALELDGSISSEETTPISDEKSSSTGKIQPYHPFPCQHTDTGIQIIPP